MGKIKVLIVDDHPVIRDGLRSILEAEEDMEVVGQAVDGREAVEAVVRCSPDVVLMDIRMPVMNGIEATAEITAGEAPPHVVILSSYQDEESVFAALRAGASGYVLKDSDSQKILRAIRSVADGFSLLSPQIAEKLQSEFQRSARSRDAQGEEEASPLSPRETEVLGLIAQGLGNKAIASQLFISEKTVKTHISNIFAKLQITDRSQAVLYAARRGLI